MTDEPRNGDCPRCYQDRYHGRQPLEACAVDGTRDRRVLVRRTLAGVAVVLCGNCAAIAGRRPLSLDELRAEVFAPGDRRGADRRAGDRRGRDRRREPLEPLELGELVAEDLERRQGPDRRGRAA